MLWLVAGCVALGLLPVQFIQLIDPVTRQLVAAGLGEAVAAQRLAAGADQRRAGELRPGDLPARRGGELRAGLPARAPLLPRPAAPRAGLGLRLSWQTARMQDTAEGFGQPIRQIFEPFFVMKRELPTPFDTQPRYRVTVADHFWHWLYLPVVALAERIARLFGLLQQGRIAIYLLYSFADLDCRCCWW